MDREKVLQKLAQIEEQAQFTLNEFPQHLNKERLRLIIALARFTILELTSLKNAEALKPCQYGLDR